MLVGVPVTAMLEVKQAVEAPIDSSFAITLLTSLLLLSASFGGGRAMEFGLSTDAVCEFVTAGVFKLLV